VNATDLDLRFMRRALQLAERARGHTSPNPLVGCVVVQEGRIVGEGFHLRAGAPHAEVMALEAAGERARGATAYVTLEPCAHYGRTPPCTLALVQAGVRRVVVAARDPNPQAQGGLEILGEHGLEVSWGLLAEEARAQNELFFFGLRQRRPQVVLKWAQSLDGQVGSRGPSRRISGTLSHQVAHTYRQWLPAIAVGVGTVLADNPALTVREVDFRPFPFMVEPPPLRDPLKVIFDREARTPPGARIFERGPRGEPARVVLFTSGAPSSRVEALKGVGAEVVDLPLEHGEPSPRAALDWLFERGYDGLLLEGGPGLAGSFLRAGLVDRLVLFVAPKLLGEGIPALRGYSGSLEAPAELHLERVERLEEDLWIEARWEGRDV